MKDTEYAFAVARIRARETSLLHAGELEAMVSARDTAEALRLLADKGWDITGAAEDPNAMLRLETETMWQLLTETAPRPEELSFLTAANDYHNVKAALKALVSGQSPSRFFLIPNSVEPERIRDAVSTRAFGKLPENMGIAAKEAYEILVNTMDAQLSDIVLDRAALEETRLRARETESGTARRVAELITVTANLKTALRAALAGKTEAFLLRALCACETLDINALAAAAANGREELVRYLLETTYSAGAEEMNISFVQFEKWCDNLLVEAVEDAKRVSFGLAPLIAYYIAKDSEVKSVRILLSCKKLGLPPESIKERVRTLYV